MPGFTEGVGEQAQREEQSETSRAVAACFLGLQGDGDVIVQNFWVAVSQIACFLLNELYPFPVFIPHPFCFIFYFFTDLRANHSTRRSWVSDRVNKQEAESLCKPLLSYFLSASVTFLLSAVVVYILLLPTYYHPPSLYYY